MRYCDDALVVDLYYPVSDSHTPSLGDPPSQQTAYLRKQRHKAVAWLMAIEITWAGIWILIQLKFWESLDTCKDETLRASSQNLFKKT